MRARSGGRVAVGHPIDVATGVLFHEFADYSMPGRMLLTFGRRYSSQPPDGLPGMFGPGWSSPFELRLERDLDGFAMIGGDGESRVPFDDSDGTLANGGVIRDLGSFHELRSARDGLLVVRWWPDRDDVVQYLFTPAGDGALRLAACQDPAGQGIDVVRNRAGQIEALMQRRERRGLTLQYDPRGRVVQVNAVGRGGGRPVLQYAYDSHARLTSCTDALGQPSSYEYDASGRMIREITKGGMVYEFRYDAEGRCAEVTGADGFDRNVLLFDTPAGVTEVTDSLGHATRYHYNGAGQVERIVSPLGRVTQTHYDESGRITKIVQPSGAAVEYDYDDVGNRSRVRLPTGAEQYYEHDEQHRLAAVIDPAGGRWSRAYDARGRLTALATALGETFQYEYDARGDLTRIRDPLGFSRAFVWSDEGNLHQSTEATGARWQFEWNAEGHLDAFTDPRGNPTTVTRDALNRLTSVRFPDGSSRAFGWTAWDLLDRLVDERGATTRWQYSSSGQLLGVVGARGGQSQLVWSSKPGQLLAVVNETGERWSYEYDADGHRTGEVDYRGRALRYVLDADGRTAVLEDSFGRSEFSRAPGGAITRIEHSDGTASRFEYDHRGLLVAAENEEGIVERAYDAVGRLIRERQGEFEITMSYDARGRRVSRRSSLGHDTRYEWDAGGQLAGLAAGKMAVISLQHDDCGNQVACRASGGVELSQAFDSRQRLSAQSVQFSNRQSGRASGAPSVLARSFTYDAASNLIERADSLRGRTRLTYDPGGQLTEAVHGEGTVERFTYGPSGDLTTADVVRAGRPERRAFVYRAGGEIAACGDARFYSDARGQIVRSAAGGGETLFAWDAAGQLRRVRLPDGAAVEYRYDALGRRLEKSDGATRTRFVWDGDVVLHELRQSEETPANVVTWEFSPTSFRPLAKFEREKPYLCVNDPVGAPQELVGADGRIAWAGSYSAWGEVRRLGGGALDCPVRYPGQWHDPETGLHYNRFRYYDPRTARYTSPDPIGLAGGLNTYWYAPNTTGWYDPYGLTGACPVEAVIRETESGRGDITSAHTLTTNQALDAGTRFLGPGYTEIGRPGSGVFRSADGLRQFRMDANSIGGRHAPGVPHVHLEIYPPGGRFPIVNNHIPFAG